MTFDSGLVAALQTEQLLYEEEKILPGVLKIKYELWLIMSSVNKQM